MTCVPGWFPRAGSDLLDIWQGGWAVDYEAGPGQDAGFHDMTEGLKRRINSLEGSWPMNWIQSLSEAIRYIEEHLADDIRLEDVSCRSYSSSSHFQLVFHLIIGMTVGEYIRCRRLSLAALDLLQPDSRIIDVAMRYRYDTQESFSKAFTRFHGIPPSKAQREISGFFNRFPSTL